MNFLKDKLMAVEKEAYLGTLAIIEGHHLVNAGLISPLLEEISTQINDLILLELKDLSFYMI